MQCVHFTSSLLWQKKIKWVTTVNETVFVQVVVRIKTVWKLDTSLPLYLLQDHCFNTLFRDAMQKEVWMCMIWTLSDTIVCYYWELFFVVFYYWELFTCCIVDEYKLESSVQSKKCLTLWLQRRVVLFSFWIQIFQCVNHILVFLSFLCPFRCHFFSLNTKARHAKN